MIILNKLATLFLLFISLWSLDVKSQDLMDLLNDEASIDKKVVESVFNTNRVISGPSTEVCKSGDLLFNIQHRFGMVNEGAYNLYGLDESTIRFGFEYGIHKRVTLGIGRASFNKTFDGTIKLKLMSQQSGRNSIPFSMTLFSGMTYKTIRLNDPKDEDYRYARMGFYHLLPVSYKFSPNISAQVTPFFVHNNIVKTPEDPNDTYGFGMAVRYKITNQFSINGEYFINLKKQVSEKQYNVFSISTDLEAGGHVFQIILTNALGMTENYFLTQTHGGWKDGNVHLGFNIARYF